MRMTSQTNYNKVTLNKISNLILAEQSFDIKSYSSGHLNENHLWKPPEQKTHKTWESSIPISNQTIIDKTILRPDSKIGIRLIKNKTHKINEVLKLPKIENDHEYQLPVSDKEFALNILNSHGFKGVTKEEKYKNIQKYDKDVLKVDDLKINNVLHSNDLGKYLETKLTQELNNLKYQDFPESRLIVHRLDIFSRIFEELIEESDIFGYILNRIKIEYDDYLFYLMKNPYKIDKSKVQGLSDLNNLFELTKQKRYTSKLQIQKLDEDIENIEKLIKKYYQSNCDLEKRIFEEELFFNEKILEQAENKPLDTSKSTRIIKKPTKCEKIEYTKEVILKKLEDLKNLSIKLKIDYVPSIVITNLNQTIKDIEIETQKITEQNKFLRSQEQEAVNELKNYLMKNDKTEFAKENVEDLMKFISNLNIIQTNYPNNESKINDLIQSANVENGNIEFKDKKFYDDYFS